MKFLKLLFNMTISRLKNKFAVVINDKIIIILFTFETTAIQFCQNHYVEK